MDIDFKAALFDLDGVLIDSETVYSEIWTDIERQFPTGIPDFAHFIKGTTLPDILERHFTPQDRPEVMAMLKERENKMVYRPFEGVREFLDLLVAKNIPAAIVTSSGEKKMNNVYAQLPWFRGYFQAVITDADVTHSKPHPEGYLKAAARLGVAPEDCCVFEDSFAGLQAGRAAGAKVIALATTNPAPSLMPFADVVINGFSPFLQ